MKCFQCGRNINDTVSFCPYCGTSQVFTHDMIQKAINGDQEVITELYNRTYNNVYHTIKAMVKDEDTVLDILQDSYIKGFQSLEQLDKPENYRAWMKRIAANKTKDWLKRKKPVLFSELADEDSGEELEFEDTRVQNLPEQVIEQQETARLVNEILDTLSEEQRLVIGMFYYEQMSVKEIAEIVGCSENTVKSRLNYGRKKIEVQVRELEKKGTKLYGLAPIPFLLLLFRNMDVQAAEIPSDSVLWAIEKECVHTSAMAGGTVAAETGSKAVAGLVGKSVAAKAIIAILTVAVVGGGIAAVATRNNAQDKKEDVIVSESVQFTSEDEEDVLYETYDFAGVYECSSNGIILHVVPIDNAKATIMLSDSFSDWNVEYEAALENELLAAYPTDETKITIDKNNGSLELSTDPHFEAKSGHVISGTYLVMDEETESVTQDIASKGIENFNGRFLKGQQILVINVSRNQTADVLLLDQRNSGVNTIIDDAATYENGELHVSLTIDWNGTTKTEIVKIQSVDENTVNLVMSKAFQERLNAPLAGEYKRDENSAGTPENAFMEENELERYLGSYSANGAIDLTLYMENGTLKAEIGDDVVLGRSVHTYTDWSIESGNYLICSWEYGGNQLSDSFHLNDDSSLTLATGGVFPELEETYQKK